MLVQSGVLVHHLSGKPTTRDFDLPPVIQTVSICGGGPIGQIPGSLCYFMAISTELWCYRQTWAIAKNEKVYVYRISEQLTVGLGLSTGGVSLKNFGCLFEAKSIWNRFKLCEDLLLTNSNCLKEHHLAVHLHFQ